MTDTTNEQTFIDAAQQVIDTARVVSPAAMEPSARAARLLSTIEAIANVFGDGAIGSAMAADAPGNAGQDNPPMPMGDPVIATCADGTVVEIPNPVVEKLNQITDSSTDFFGKGAFGAILSFFVNAAADIAAVLPVFGQIGQIQSQQMLNGYLAARPNRPISAEIAADMVERNILEKSVALMEALANGTDAARFDALIAASGEPPGIEQMLALYRRDLIDIQTFSQAVAYSRVKTEYICNLLDMAHETMSAADAVEAYVKGVPVTPADFTNERLTPPALVKPIEPANPTPAEAKAYENAIDKYNSTMENEFYAAMFRRGGGLPSQWNVLKQAAGDAIGVERAAALEAHGDITLEQLKQVIRRSRINPIFEYLGLMGNDKWFSAFQIGSILTAQPQLAPQALQWLLEDGYPEDQAKAYVAAKSGAKAAKLKAETESQVLASYQSGFINADDATSELESLGYPAAAIPAILATHDARKVIAQQDLVVSKVRNMFLAGRWDATKVRAELTNLSVSAKAIDHYLKVWQVEKDTTEKAITPSQIGRLYHMGRIGTSEAQHAWSDMGYTEHEIQYLTWEYTPTVRSLANAAPAPNIKP